MLKLKQISLSVVLLFTFSGCELSEELQSETTKQYSYENYEKNTAQGALEFLNTIRVNSGLPAFRFEEKLNTMASNHAKYLNYHKIGGHTEEGKKYFTGKTGSDRADYVDHNYKGEVLSRGNDTYIGATRGLMSAIYHRFIFFSFSADAIGMEFIQNDYNVFVSDLGNSQLEDICTNGITYDTTEQSYYGNICSNGKHIPSSVYLDAKYSIKKASDEVILYPYENQLDFGVFFDNHEIPDPLPDYDSYVGNPISIQFNDYYIENVEMYSFELYEHNTTLVNDVRILDINTDPNERFDNHEYALFPLEVLKKDSWYKVKAHFLLDGEEWHKTWHFKTQK